MKQFFKVIGFTIFVDQIFKFWAVSALIPAQVSINPGMSFSWQLPLIPASFAQDFLLVGLVTLVLALFFWQKKYWAKHQLASGLFFGGAISNILDRFFYGGVVDWLPIPFSSISNNFADWAIVIGGVSFAFASGVKNEK